MYCFENRTTLVYVNLYWLTIHQFICVSILSSLSTLMSPPLLLILLALIVNWNACNNSYKWTNRKFNVCFWFTNKRFLCKVRAVALNRYSCEKLPMFWNTHHFQNSELKSNFDKSFFAKLFLVVLTNDIENVASIKVVLSIGRILSDPTWFYVILKSKMSRFDKLYVNFQTNFWSAVHESLCKTLDAILFPALFWTEEFSLYQMLWWLTWPQQHCVNVDSEHWTNLLISIIVKFSKINNHQLNKLYYRIMSQILMRKKT